MKLISIKHTGKKYTNTAITNLECSLIFDSAIGPKIKAKTAGAKLILTFSSSNQENQKYHQSNIKKTISNCIRTYHT